MVFSSKHPQERQMTKMASNIVESKSDIYQTEGHKLFTKISTDANPGDLEEVYTNLAKFGLFTICY